MELIESIKHVAHRAAENYLLSGECMDDVIFQAYIAGEIENDEVLKRVCEQANQNVYLSLFNNSSVDKSNIKFEMADWNAILATIKQRETEMKEYDAPPADFRTSPASDETVKVSSLMSASKKLGFVHQVVNYTDRLEKLASTFESMRVSEVNKAEEAFIKMSHDAKIVVANNESLGDMAKIAARMAVSMGVGFEKVASAYGIIQKDLCRHGFSVDTEFTKLSSMKIDESSKILEPVKDFVLAIEKAAAFREMRDSARERHGKFVALTRTCLNAIKSR